MRFRAWAFRYLAGVVLAFCGAVQAAPFEAEGHLQSNEQHERLLLLNRGDYVQGNWQQDEAVSLHLFDPQGTPWRDLSLPSEKHGEFGFVAAQDGEYRLRLTGQGNYQWTITQIVPLDEQQDLVKTPLQSDLILQWQRRLQTGEGTDAFWAQIKKVGSPLVERLSSSHDRVTFVWRGAQRSVQLRGGPGLLDGGQLHRLADSDIWYVTYDIPRNALFSYQLAPDTPQGVTGKTAARSTLQADPYNPRRLYPTVRDNFRNRSVLSLSRAPQALLGDDTAAHIAQGRLQSFEFNSVILENQRTVRIYTPPVAEGQNIEHVMVLLDGEDYLKIVNAPAMVDTLMREGKIAPVQLVLVGNAKAPARVRELPPHKPDFVEFLDQELLPWMAEHGVQASRENTIIAGSSYGGLAALNAGLNLPQHFGKVLSMSGSFGWGPQAGPAEWLVHQFVERERVPIDVYMSAGLYEDVSASQGVSLLRANRHMYDVLRAKGYPVQYTESPTAHGFISWDRVLPQGLEYFLGKAAQQPDAAEN